MQIVKECEGATIIIKEKYTKIYGERICPKIINVAKYDSNKHLQAELSRYDASYATGEN